LINLINFADNNKWSARHFTSDSAWHKRFASESQSM